MTSQVPAGTIEDSASPPKVGGRYIWMTFIATGGIFVAFVAPIAISLAVRLQQLAPGHQEYLGYVSGIAATAAIISSPVVGILSDRTRSRLGRRRPWILAGTAVGCVALVVMAAAQSVFVLGLGWCIAQVGWGSAFTVVNTTQADRVPEDQRGKVSGLLGVATMAGPVTGAGIAASLVSNPYLMLLVPGVVGAIAAIVFVIFVGGDDSRGLELPAIRLRSVLTNYLYSPRRHRDFSWNWLARFLFYVGLTFATTFTLYFLASRLGLSVDKVAGLAAVLALGNVVTSALGSVAGGFLSDRIRRRRVFVLLAALVFTAGTLLMASTSTLAVLLTGSLVSSLGLGLFGSVDSAIVLDVLPERRRDAGRFMGINGFSQSIAQALAPLVAPSILLIGTTGQQKNYTLLFLVAAAFTLLSGIVVMTKVKGSR